MRKIIETAITSAVAIAAVISLVGSANAQLPASLTNSVVWDFGPGSVSFDVVLTTNKTRILTNGHTLLPAAIIASATTFTNRIALTNLWPQITNGVFSVFVQVDGVSTPSLLSTNLVFEMQIPPSPAYNLRLQ